MTHHHWRAKFVSVTFGGNLPLSPTELILNSLPMCVYITWNLSHTHPEDGCHQCQRVFPGVKLAAAGVKSLG